MTSDHFFIYSLTQQGLMAMQTSSNRQEMKGYLRRYLLFLVSKEIAMSVQIMQTIILHPRIILIQN